MPDFNYSMVFSDAYNGKAVRTYRITAADIAAARVVADGLLAAAGNLSTAGIIQETLSSQLPVAGVPAAASNIDQGITFQYSLGGLKTASLNFPSPDLQVINPDRTVDLGDAAVVAWNAPFIAGDVLVSDGEVVASVIGGTLDK